MKWQFIFEAERALSARMENDIQETGPPMISVHWITRFLIVRSCIIKALLWTLYSGIVSKLHKFDHLIRTFDSLAKCLQHQSLRAHTVFRPFFSRRLAKLLYPLLLTAWIFEAGVAWGELNSVNSATHTSETGFPVVLNKYCLAHVCYFCCSCWNRNGIYSTISVL